MIGRVKFFLVLFCSILVLEVKSQTDFTINKIRELQIKEQGKLYNVGLFPSQRVWKKDMNIVEDNNIFFTGLILYTLKPIHDSL